MTQGKTTSKDAADEQRINGYVMRDGEYVRLDDLEGMERAGRRLNRGRGRGDLLKSKRATGG